MIRVDLTLEIALDAFLQSFVQESLSLQAQT